ncbi:hypothetical protein GCM10009425_48630 [Pseudomonas asuensis]|uniref:DUF4116 domain-containing protein n=1 Tax=Pseudomonas asuensis TaxID=1825787 RepID=A0ABQ2H4U9_9PSED|nr:hypothetical protein [Pseudomonas asuensis]GGM32409.1 hypothetical protein GCM10009425_48630 [Pseudomonas asuensis]
MRPVGAQPSLFVRTPELSDALSKTASATTQLSEPSATSQQEGLTVPNSYLLNETHVKVGSWQPLKKEEDKNLMPYLFRPKGEVTEEHLPNQDIRCQYQVVHPDSPFEVTAVYGPGRQLKELSAESTSNPDRKFPVTMFTALGHSKSSSSIVSSVSNLSLSGEKDLERLSNEMLDLIAEHTDPNGILALRQTNRHLNAIADKHITDTQRFLMKHAQALGFSKEDIKALLKMPEEHRNFIVENGVKLHAAGHSAFQMNALAQEEEERNFVLQHCVKLHAAGHDPVDMGEVFEMSENQQSFILENCTALHALRHSAEDMGEIAEMPEDQRSFIVENGVKLLVLGHNTEDMKDFAKRTEPGRALTMENSLAKIPELERNFLLENAIKLLAAGHDIYSMQILAYTSEEVHNFVVVNGAKLYAAGHFPSDMSNLAENPEKVRNFVVQNCTQLHAAGIRAAYMPDVAKMSEEQRIFFLENCVKLYAEGHSNIDIFNIAEMPKDKREAVISSLTKKG